ncbi:MULTISPECIES: hypothetical protein [unclassified Rhodococcus (in: high G+C Gram-positive bacteria)]|uniref:hypothetical protein n=1 Tax=unclassified Rhodococcus (in: high G+C Gram-positive bacteria) TaxID=192944 RepID=UPI0020784FE9|nr:MULTISPECIES: hypothetical protein [unclassified Rhodococcus (in: high G+C Gram-positive bacteria)]
MSIGHRRRAEKRGSPGLSPGSLEEPSEPAESESDSTEREGTTLPETSAGGALAACVGAAGTGVLSFGLDGPDGSGAEKLVGLSDP